MTEIAIGFGIVFSLVLTETLGVTAGGLIVPGYIALNLHDPLRVVGTFIISLIVFTIVKLLAEKLLIYGKRRLVFSLLLGFLLGYLSKQYMYFPDDQINLSAIGNIIPGLIASWMERQGVVRTISVVLITATIIQLLLMVFGMEVPHV
ncbi:MAG: poly-gamma-glutamate biosynthesis protein PgsC [Candidatus Marinimicrobia bacterium]|nr:poly-gamma-glutamate biosynthesis protein PgsC [Candidatus Neomarinimicrobiota bacterium]MBL7059947.1 poly-gamma-glutamate biosynthesis protein PgsC [Candidatus Neomarinimicrobiota bacterium]